VTAIEIHGALTLSKSEWRDDWYVIERRDHDGRMWIQPTEYGSSLMCSASISDADVEGTADQMALIAMAIERRCSFSAKRCEVRVDGDKVYFCSPRNSTRDAVVPLAVADALAREIMAVLGGMNPSAEWHKAADAAIASVAVKEGR
jgi:hypothetical protein